jgi:DNA-binding transcriptional MerR regulator
VLPAGRTCSIGAPSKMLGVSPATPRSWEDRYAVVVPERSGGSQRLYSREQVDQLLFVCDQMRRGLSAADAPRVLAEHLASGLQLAVHESEPAERRILRRTRSLRAGSCRVSARPKRPRAGSGRTGVHPRTVRIPDAGIRGRAISSAQARLFGRRIASTRGSTTSSRASNERRPAESSWTASPRNSVRLTTAGVVQVRSLVPG